MLPAALVKYRELKKVNYMGQFRHRHREREIERERGRERESNK